MSDTANRELVISRRFSAPRDLVFEAWTQAEHLDRWMGPRGFETTTHSLDFRVGGEWHYTMRHAEHGTFPNRIRYLEIVPNERLVYDHDAGVDGDPRAFHVTVTFVAVGAQTEVTMRSLLASAEAVEAAKRFGAVEGGQQTLTRLGEALDASAETDLVIERELAAPLAKVWRAWTSAEALGAWWGPKGLGLRVERFDLRPGGLFHYAMLPPGGAPPMWGRFQFRVIEPEVRLEWINSFADEAGEIIRPPIAPEFPLEIYNQVLFTAAGDRTRMTLRGRPLRANAAERAFFAGMHAGMQGGFGGTFSQLEDWLAR
ncbi:MAG: SRPBCC family protein [Pseudomonadota bacterium]|nr:SRPBCC family protein [Pseudomonadota bacterium]